MAEVLVRDAVLDDAPSIAAVQIAAWRAAYVGVMTAEYLAALDQAEFAANWRETLTEMAATTDEPAVGSGPCGPDPTAGSDGSAGERAQVGADAVCGGGPPPGSGRMLPDAVLVGEVDGRIVAIASVGPFRQRSAADDPTGELWMLNADPAVFGTGAALAVHDAALARLAAGGHRHAVLWVVRDNPRARRFYEREGWRTDGNDVVADMGGVPVTELRYLRSLVDA
jgi:ribosomal protein S18 acetylase RimI-like enzyme